MVNLCLVKWPSYISHKMVERKSYTFRGHMCLLEKGHKGMHKCAHEESA